MLPQAAPRNDATQIEHKKLSCMEVWGGNDSTWSSFVVPGLDLWIYCKPVNNESSGGDVYYVSSCASGRLTRLLLGDISGHGSEAAPHARTLRNIMRRNVNHLQQNRMVGALNEEFDQVACTGRFATAIVGTYFAPTRELTLCSAGHPSPLVFSSASSRWSQVTSGDDTLRNLPLGVLETHEFESTSLKLHTGDLVLCYSDALCEACDTDGSPLHAEGLARIATTVAVTEPAEFVETLLQTIRALHPSNLQLDDVTVILARANSQRVSLKDNLMSPFRYLRGLTTDYYEAV